MNTAQRQNAQDLLRAVATHATTAADALEPRDTRAGTLPDLETFAKSRDALERDLAAAQAALAEAP